MRKLIATISAGILATSLAACSSGGDSGTEASSAPTSGDETLTVAFSFGQSVHPFFIAMEKGARDAAEELGVEFVTTSADYVVENQVKNIEDLLQRGVDGLLVNPIDSEALSNVVQESLDADVPVVTVDIDVTGADTTSFVASDNAQIGAMAAEYIIDQLGGEGTVAVLGNPVVTSTMQREEGFLAAIAEAPGIEVVANAGEAMERQTALDAAETILQANPDLGAIFGVNESGALGALGAVQARGIDTIILGVDATPDMLAAVQAGGNVKATISQDPYQMGYDAMQIIVKHLHGEAVATEQSAPIDLVTIENVQVFIDREAQYAAE